ncbi:MAG: hypothetical protein A2887_02880 [Alphaproteobacteria bacterium RIFCSPLOWO2_01_FULL_40_26]|nr:MAG: hypothetical protein A3D15_02655 [Alphaproteobacteria bacterium RIFCSPHIGHO2_02_FULL_40_34]OFW95108.1 MAG: hypothetical protein A2887_02880 [Alphaproteobacteria bacterium RIFCSPLOWO2_01_FULL_40_26]OFX09069.1 MAG: hypothetical protein A3H30_03470 [Alphaproteobacteria bacterium RIFCSPLOWO2_02_FULL_40_19]OFX10710.1 MAG: hypothetical protein A3G22_03310 [Alphaproteobacteria bacterium RIFCSPLOWO2_12_FULL_40_11]
MNNETKRSKIPYIFFIFFAVIIVVNVAYIYISKKTWRGVVTDHSYQKGVNYNQEIESAKQQEKLQWQVMEKYIRFAPNKGKLMVSIMDKSLPIKDAEVYVTFKRPVQEGFDFAEVLHFVDGMYQAEVAFPFLGQWDAEIMIVKGKDNFKMVKRYIIQ